MRVTFLLQPLVFYKPVTNPCSSAFPLCARETFYHVSCLWDFTGLEDMEKVFPIYCSRREYRSRGLSKSVGTQELGGSGYF